MWRNSTEQWWLEEFSTTANNPGVSIFTKTNLYTLHPLCNVGVLKVVVHEWLVLSLWYLWKRDESPKSLREWKGPSSLERTELFISFSAFDSTLSKNPSPPPLAKVQYYIRGEWAPYDQKNTRELSGAEISSLAAVCLSYWWFFWDDSPEFKESNV